MLTKTPRCWQTSTPNILVILLVIFCAKEKTVNFFWAQIVSITSCEKFVFYICDTFFFVQVQKKKITPIEIQEVLLFTWVVFLFGYFLFVRWFLGLILKALCRYFGRYVIWCIQFYAWWKSRRCNLFNIFYALPEVSKKFSKLSIYFVIHK